MSNPGKSTGASWVFNTAGSIYLELLPNKEKEIIRLPFFGAGVGMISCSRSGMALSLEPKPDDRKIRFFPNYLERRKHVQVNPKQEYRCYPALTFSFQPQWLFPISIASDRHKQLYDDIRQIGD